jgi:hypothetical protein
VSITEVFGIVSGCVLEVGKATDRLGRIEVTVVRSHFATKPDSRGDESRDGTSRKAPLARMRRFRYRFLRGRKTGL